MCLETSLVTMLCRRMAGKQKAHRVAGAFCRDHALRRWMSAWQVA